MYFVLQDVLNNLANILLIEEQKERRMSLQKIRVTFFNGHSV